ncbi:MAG: pantetheine-phosphate adenylyltransferase [Spirochaetes bacterium]|jgi:pantetheine-phosphate adenylyltransferase|nr:pantetheine-phosphate adenylyltransferase [Spirochaetota bacterium]
MRIGIYPGSFDPLTKGHIDIIKRSREICDKLIIAVAINSSKKPLFTVEERLEIINNCCKDIGGIESSSFEGLLVDFCKKNGVNLIIRGLRSLADFEYEFSIATINSKLAPEIESIFLMTRGENLFISSNIAREIASYQGDVSSLVPRFVEEKIRQKYSK